MEADSVALAASFLSPAFIAAVVSAFVSFIISERRIAAENVIQERKNWRDTMRELAKEIDVVLANLNPQPVARNALRAKCALHLNPHDPEDVKILDLITEGRSEHRRELTVRIALLLKHDWERAKREDNLTSIMLQNPPDRVLFKDFKPGAAHKYRIWPLDECRVFWFGEMRRKTGD